MSVTTAALSLGLLPSAGVAAPDDPTSIDAAKAKVGKAYRQAEQATERYHEITDELKDTKSEIKALRKDVSHQQQAYDALRSEVGGTVADQLTSSPMGPTAELLTKQDPSEFLDGLSALQSYSSNQQDRLAKFEEAAKQLSVRKDQLDSEVKTVQHAKKQMAKEKKLRDEKVDEAKAVLDRLTAEQRERMRRAEERRAAASAEAADGAAAGQDSSRSAPSADASGGAQKAVQFAMAQLGEPYVYGATGPGSWDCSGLTSAAWAAAGVSLPRSSSQQAGAGSSASTSSMSPGDLVFYYSPISHVGMYIGHGKLVHAPHPGSSVEVVPVDSMPVTAVRHIG